MKKLDLRIKDDPKIWSKLPRSVDDALDYLFDRLVEQNKKLKALGEKEVWGIYDAKVRKRVRPAQENLVAVIQTRLGGPERRNSSVLLELAGGSKAREASYQGIEIA